MGKIRNLLIIIFILSIARLVFGSYGEIQPDGTYSIQGLWHLNDNSSPESDSSGNGYDGTVDGATYIESGKFQGAYDFDGTNDRIDTADMAIPSSYSISAWVSADDVDGERIIIIKGAPTVSIWLAIHSSAFKFGGVFGGSWKEVAGTTSPSTTIWYFIVGVFDNAGDTIKIYINGLLENTTTGVTGNPTNDNDDLVIGSTTEGANYWSGQIDEVCFWTRDLSAAEIRQIYASQSGMYSIE